MKLLEVRNRNGLECHIFISHAWIEGGRSRAEVWSVARRKAAHHARSKQSYKGSYGAVRVSWHPACQECPKRPVGTTVIGSPGQSTVPAV